MALKKQVIGWRETAALPDLGVDAIKVKVDTGARTSAVHAFEIERFQRDGAEWVRFFLHPVARHSIPEIECEARIVDEREITSSTGERQKRIIISTTLRLGDREWPIELSLASRDQMGFRMLIGREAMRGHAVVDPGRSYLAEKHRYIRTLRHVKKNTKR